MSDQVKEPAPATDARPAAEQPKKKSPRFRGYHLRRRFRSGRARKEGPL